jgi:hypothetical protein
MPFKKANNAVKKDAMKPMRSCLPVFLNLLCLAALPASGASNRDVFPLMAWDYAEDTKTMEAMRDCGITCIAFARPEQLNACQKAGLKAVVFDESIIAWRGKAWDGERVRSNLPALVKKIGKHPAVMGYHIEDEPSTRDFPELAKAVAAVKEFAPGKWPYINLFPAGYQSYEKTAEDFISICHPTALSYDLYALVGTNDFNPRFWFALAQMRGLALKHQLPLWNIVLSTPHWGYREITEADVRLQSWGSLAYGVSGLAFYKFNSKELPILNAIDLGNFRNGPLDQFGEKTPTWQWLRNCNRQIQNLAPVYLKLHSDDVYHFGVALPKGNHGPTETNLVKALLRGKDKPGDTNLVNSLPKSEFVVGDFTHADGTRYALIVNKSLTASAQCTPEFNGSHKLVKYVSPITGETKPFPARLYWLAPGAGVLLRLE